MPKVTRYKKEAYEQAVQYRKRGFSYREIAKICDVSVSTLSSWLSHEKFSKLAAKDNTRRAVADNTKRLTLINKARNTQRKGQYAAIERMAEVEYKNYRTSPLFVAGLMMYVSEGDSQNLRLIRMANSRPDLHKIFLKFLVTYLGVEKSAVRFWLLLYPDLDEVVCMKHWCKKVGISPSQFYKNQVIQGRSTKRTLHFGVGNTIIGSTLLKKKLMRWIALATKELEK